MKQVFGSQLSETEQKKALARWVHRFTGDHKPAWANAGHTPLQFKDDKDWLAHTKFFVTASGRLSERHKVCESHPTWPNNPELRGAKK